jgi:nicotinate-nucleotide--dimethylbenzimidazole phosphoribosyltransferase
VSRRGVSAYPAEVTAQMVANFASGGAAINQLTRAAGARLRVIPLELDRPTAARRIGVPHRHGDFCRSRCVR